MMLYNKENRQKFRVSRVSLSKFDDGSNIITAYSNKQHLESFNVKDKYQARDIYRTLNTDLISNSHSDKGFWSDFDYFKSKEKEI